ncbi:hypothetical protein Acsp07_23350 [Actinomycetospora sp. NBRC 106378]|nr:hypothetical protein Acsp07_23350 [Actinomycetospora sp. NBRC 106378]
MVHLPPGPRPTFGAFSTIRVTDVSDPCVPNRVYGYGDAVNVQKVVGILVAILVVFWIISSPSTAAGTVNGILDSLASAGSSLIQFLRGIAPG